MAPVVVVVGRFLHCPENISDMSNIMQNKKEGKDQESIHSRATPDSGYHMGK